MNIQILDKNFTLFMSHEVIKNRIKDMARQINADFQAKTPLILPVLNGAFPFAAELAKHLTIFCEFEFIKISSYKGEISAKHQPFIMLGVDTSTVENKDVLIVEDIVDTGKTMEILLNYIQHRNPKSTKIACLFHKHNLSPQMRLDYVGFQIPNDFIVGYGLDYANLGRNLPDVYKLTDTAHVSF